MDSRVIFHIDEVQKWNLLLHNVRNLLVSYGAEHSGLSVEVLANSDAVKGYEYGSGLADQDLLKALSQQNVMFAACSNALHAMNLSKENIFSFVKVVPVGIRELLDRQREGYAYIKP